MEPPRQHRPWTTWRVFCTLFEGVVLGVILHVSVFFLCLQFGWIRLKHELTHVPNWIEAAFGDYTGWVLAGFIAAATLYAFWSEDRSELG